MTGPVLHREETGNGTEEVIVGGPLNRGIVRFQTSEPQDRGRVSPKIIEKITRGRISCFVFLD